MKHFSQNKLCSATKRLSHAIWHVIVFIKQSTPLAVVTFAGENEQKVTKSENIELSFIHFKDIFYKITNQTYVG